MANGVSEESQPQGHSGKSPIGPLIVMPTYREAANIQQVLRDVRSSEPSSTVLVVDDEGSDGTADLAEQTGWEIGGVEVLRQPRKGGLARAYRAGFAWGLDRGYGVLVGMDADLSHDPIALPRLLEAIAHGADVAIGSRYVQGGSTTNWPLSRRALSRAGNWYASTCLVSKISDLTSAFRAYRAEALRTIDFDHLRADGYGFLIEMAYLLEKSGVQFVEVPVNFINRAEGRSKMSAKIAVESFRVVTLMALSARRGIKSGLASDRP
jgi:dolichol-phosphate mannosyltransferase